MRYSCSCRERRRRTTHTTKQIERAILSLEGGRYQRLVEEYLAGELNQGEFSFLGTKAGTDKVTKGTPDAFFLANGTYAFMEAGNVPSHREAVKKLRKDLEKVYEEIGELGGPSPARQVSTIMLAYTCTDVTPTELEAIRHGDSRVRFLGLNELAQRLKRYPSLLQEYLGMSVQSGQIMDFKGFLDRCAGHAYNPSHRHRLIRRDVELARLEAAIKENQVVIVTGSSGSGKTRLALEAVHAFEASGSVTAWYCSSNRLPYLEELGECAEGSGAKLVLLDDANEFLDLRALANFLVDHEDMKLVATVRDYAERDVREELSVVSAYEVLELDRLGVDSFDECLRDADHGLTQAFLDHLWTVTHGNLRFALLCVKQLSKEDNEVPMADLDLSDILRNTYGAVIEALNEEDADTLTVAAIMRHGWTSGEPAEGLSGRFGLSIGAFAKSLRQLHTQEFVRLSTDGRAFVVSEQNMRDYLVYEAICDKKSIRLEDLCECGFSGRQVGDLGAQLVNVFPSDDVLECVRTQLDEVWDNHPELHLDLLFSCAPLLRRESVIAVLASICSGSGAGAEKRGEARDEMEPKWGRVGASVFSSAMLQLSAAGEDEKCLARLFCNYVDAYGCDDAGVSEVLGSAFGYKPHGLDDRVSLVSAAALLDEIASRLGREFSPRLGRLMCMHTSNLLHNTLWHTSFLDETDTARIYKGTLSDCGALLELREKSIGAVGGLLRHDETFDLAERCLLGVDRGDGVEGEGMGLAVKTADVCLKTYVGVVPRDRWDVVRLADLCNWLAKCGNAVELPAGMAAVISDIGLVLHLGACSSHRPPTRPQAEQLNRMGPMRQGELVRSVASTLGRVSVSPLAYRATAGLAYLLANVGMGNADRACDFVADYIRLGGTYDFHLREVTELVLEHRGWHWMRGLVLEGESTLCKGSHCRAWIEAIDAAIVRTGHGDEIANSLLVLAKRGQEAQPADILFQVDDVVPGYYQRYLFTLLKAGVRDGYSVVRALPTHDDERYAQTTEMLARDGALTGMLEEWTLLQVGNGFPLASTAVTLCADAGRGFGSMLAKRMCEKDSVELMNARSVARALWASQSSMDMVEGFLVAVRAIEIGGQEVLWTVGEFCKEISEEMPCNVREEDYIRLIASVAVYADEAGYQKVSKYMMWAMRGMPHGSYINCAEEICRAGLAPGNVSALIQDPSPVRAYSNSEAELYDASIKNCRELEKRLDPIEFASIREALGRLVSKLDAEKVAAISREMAMGI